MSDRLSAHNDANEQLREQFRGLVIDSVDFGHVAPESGEEAWRCDDAMRLNTNRGPIVVETSLIFGPRIVMTVHTDELRGFHPLQRLERILELLRLAQLASPVSGVGTYADLDRLIGEAYGEAHRLLGVEFRALTSPNESGGRDDR